MKFLALQTIVSHFGLFCCLIFLAGCKVGDLTTERISAIASSVQSISKAARPMGDDEEYYVGRAVAARLTSTYTLHRDSRLNEYVNLIGQVIALHSEKPATFGGYHFAILDSREINAFACPGGIIFITKGMLSSVKSEEELAAVLAHEIAHVIHRDGIAAIKSSRWSEALLVIGSNAAKEFGSSDTAKLVSLFEGSVDDVFKTLVVNGYGRDQEKAADSAALGYLSASGYDPKGLTGYLKRLEQSAHSSKGGILSTHPGTADRLENIQMSNINALDSKLIAYRTKRFTAMFR